MSVRQCTSEWKVLRDNKMWCLLPNGRRAELRNSLGRGGQCGKRRHRLNKWVNIGLIKVFWLKEGKAEDLETGEYQMLKIIDEFMFISKNIPRFRISMVYKRKVNKV